MFNMASGLIGSHLSHQACSALFKNENRKMQGSFLCVFIT